MQVEGKLQDIRLDPGSTQGRMELAWIRLKAADGKIIRQRDFPPLKLVGGQINGVAPSLDPSAPVRKRANGTGVLTIGGSQGEGGGEGFRSSLAWPSS